MNLTRITQLCPGPYTPLTQVDSLARWTNTLSPVTGVAGTVIVNGPTPVLVKVYGCVNGLPTATPPCSLPVKVHEGMRATPLAAIRSSLPNELMSSTPPLSPGALGAYSAVKEQLPPARIVEPQLLPLRLNQVDASITTPTASTVPGLDSVTVRRTVSPV